MSSLILRTAVRFLIPLLLLFSFFTLFRGHHLPGGGFAGGLLAATAFALYIFAWDVGAARRAMAVDPHILIGSGLLLALASGLPLLFAGKPFLTGYWVRLPRPNGTPIDIGTPVIFDIGVYVVVIGAVLLIITTLAEEQEDQS